MITLNIQLFGPAHTDWTTEDCVQYISDNFPDMVPISPLGFDPETNKVCIKLNQEKLTDVQTDWLHLTEIASAIDTYTVEPMPEFTLRLSGDQAKVIARILATKPTLVYEDAKYESVYTLSAYTNGDSLIAGFNRWGDQNITQTIQDDNYQMIARRVTFNNGGIAKMDALCAAWIEFRTKHPIPQEQNQTQDDELGDLNEHPF